LDFVAEICAKGHRSLHRGLWSYVICPRCSSSLRPQRIKLHNVRGDRNSFSYVINS
jgi:hypothetical protein